MSKKTAIIAYDGRVYIFHASLDEEAPATCVELLYDDDDDPMEPYPWIYSATSKVPDRLGLKPVGSKEVLPIMVASRIQGGTCSDFKIGDLTRTYPRATMEQKPVGGAKHYHTTTVTRNDTIYRQPQNARNNCWSWELRLAKFTFCGGADISVDYAPVPLRFVKLCKKYRLDRIFMPKPVSLISFDHRKGVISKKGDTVVLHGRQDERDCVVKRVKAVSRSSDFFYVAKKLRLCSNHNNVVQIYETKFNEDEDKDHYFNIAMEKCDCNFVEFDAENEDYYVKKKLIKDVVLGIAHLHENGVTHGSIRASNVLINKYRTGAVARLGGLSRSRYKKSDDETIPHNNIPADAKKKGWYYQDLFGVARFILDFETRGSYDKTNPILKKEDIDKLLEIDGVAHNLVYAILAKTYSMSALDVSNHHYFWPRGSYLNLIQRVSDRVSGDEPDYAFGVTVDKYGTKNIVYDTSWHIPGIDIWLTAMGGPNAYDGTKLSRLLRMTRNTVHHPPTKKTWKAMGTDYNGQFEECINTYNGFEEYINSTCNGFEEYINYHFPRLFQTICFIAMEDNKKTNYFKDFF